MKYKKEIPRTNEGFVATWGGPRLARHVNTREHKNKPLKESSEYLRLESDYFTHDKHVHRPLSDDEIIMDAVYKRILKQEEIDILEF